MNDEIVSERCGVALGEFSDALFFDFLRREERMLALRKVVTAHALQSFFSPFDFLSDMLRVEIYRYGVVEDLKRSESPEDPAACPLGTAFEDDEIVIESVCKKSEVPSRLNTLVPAVLMD